MTDQSLRALNDEVAARVVCIYLLGTSEEIQKILLDDSHPDNDWLTGVYAEVVGKIREADFCFERVREKFPEAFKLSNSSPIMGMLGLLGVKLPENLEEVPHV